MAKALIGHISTADGRSLALAAEVRRLRLRVSELECQLDAAISANEQLHRSMSGVSPVMTGALEAELLHLDAIDEPAYS